MWGEYTQEPFAGASVNIVISDDDLDQVDYSWETKVTIGYVIAKGHILVRCKNCDRILIEARDTGKISVFQPDVKG